MDPLSFAAGTFYGTANLAGTIESDKNFYNSASYTYCRMMDTHVKMIDSRKSIIGSRIAALTAPLVMIMANAPGHLNMGLSKIAGSLSQTICRPVVRLFNYKLWKTTCPHMKMSEGLKHLAYTVVIVAVAALQFVMGIFSPKGVLNASYNHSYNKASNLFSEQKLDYFRKLIISGVGFIALHHLVNDTSEKFKPIVFGLGYSVLYFVNEIFKDL